MTLQGSGDLKADIAAALDTGATLALDYNSIVKSADPNTLGNGVILVDIDDIDKKLASLSQLSGLLGGQSLAALVPSGILPPFDIAIRYVSFKLFAASKRVGSVSCCVAFSSGGAPLTWNIATIGSADLSVTLDTITVNWSDPLQPMQLFGAVIYGGANIGKLPLDVTLTFPDVTLSIDQPSEQLVNLGDFFGQFGLPKVDFIDKLDLRGLQLVATPGDRSFGLQATIETDGLVPLPLLTIQGRNILAFDNMWFALSHAPGATNGSIGGQITVLNGLVLGASASLDTQSGTWSFDGEIDVAGTWANLNPGKPIPAKPLITVADFATIFAPGSNPPDALKSLGIAALSFDYTYANGSTSTYTLNGVFDGAWPISGGLSAEVSVTLGSAGNTISGEFDLDQFSFVLTYTFGAGSKTIAANIKAGDILSLSGSYDVDSGVVQLTLDQDLSFDKLIAWFVGEVTHNRYYTLPDPWDTLLAAVTLPAGLKLTIDTNNKKIDCGYRLPNPISFLGFTLSGVDIGYDSARNVKGQSGLNVHITSDLPSWVTAKGDWDPGTQSPPKVPGTQAARLEIKLLGAGQHIGFNTKNPPVTVEDAINDLTVALDPANWTGGLFPTTSMKFDKDIGWLIGSEVVLLGQVDIKFIFNDPIVYGLSLIVSKGDSDALNVLAGLSAEIIYRKVSDTVGVYEGMLTLPSDIRKIDLNTVVITLPSLALSIYTNGDFKIDVGFPYNRDFSRSCSVVAGEYAGAGGFYYAKLDGLDPAELPQIDTTKGIFSPVTEIGIGFEIGVTKSFSAGPLSSSLSVMLQAIFQGVFAKYTRYSNGNQSEFFSVDATIAIVGHLVGKLDFYIITASLEVTIYIEVDLKLVAYRKTVAQVEVSVSVELTVSINCGFFTIHIHCGFSTTLHTQASFGNDSTAPWDNALAAPNLRLMSPRLMSDAPPSVGWQPIADSAALTVYFIPQLTAGLAYPQSDGNTYWYYVGQLGLSNPTTSPNTTNPASYAAFVRGMLRWTLYAYGRTHSLTPVAAATANDAPVTQDSIVQLLTLLSGPSGVRPLRDDVQAQFKAAFQIAVQALPAGGTDYGVGFFPAVPGMTLSLQADGNTPVTLTPVRLSAADLHAAKQAGPAHAAPTMFLAHLQAVAADVPTTLQDISEIMLVDFAMLAVRSGLQNIIDAKILPTSDSMKIGDLLDKLQDSQLGSISGMTSRFMLHGARQPMQQDGTLEPLYALTGQQARLTPAELKAANLTMSLALAQGTPADWGMTFQGGGSSLSISSKDTNQAVFRPNQIPATPSFAPKNVQCGAMPMADIRPARFYVVTGIVQDGGGSGIWQLPSSLADLLLQKTNTDAFTVSYLANSKAQPVPAAAEYVLSVDFRVRRIPANDGTPSYLAYTYELFDVDQGGLQSLEAVIQLIAAKQTPVSDLSLAYASDPSNTGSGTTARKALITPVDFSRTFIVQSNFSTETRPPQNTRLLRATPPDLTKTINSFLTKLWTAGITNSGGYYLLDAPPEGQSAGLPDTLFDSGGVATLTMVAGLAVSNGSSPVVLPAYVTGLRTPDYLVGGTGALFLASDQVKAVRALLPPGHVGVAVSCDAPTQPPGPGTLDYLYNLITADSIALNGTVLPQNGQPPVFGPVNPEAAGTWNYTHVFPLIGGPIDPPPPVPPASLNPYVPIGATVAFGLTWTDIFGNQWGPVTPATPAAPTKLGYVDPLISLSQLPYLTLDYLFDGASGSPKLQIGFAFKTPTYQPDDAKRWRQDVATYAQAYYQLAALAGGEQVAATVSTSLLVDKGVAKPIPIDISIIRNNIAAIYKALVVAAPGPTTILILPVLNPVDITVAGSGVTINAELKFPLTVAMTFVRTGNVSDKFPAEGPVKTIGMTVAPRTANQNGDKHSLAAFASAFETAFTPQDLVLAVGASSGQGINADSHQVWVVRYGASGITVAFPQQAAIPAYFAPRPLDNTLRSRSVSVRQLDGDGNLVDGSTVAFTDIDLDAQMQKFLTAVDQMFSAADAIPTALLAPQAINDLSTQKKAIVEKLLGYVTDLNSGASYDPGNSKPTNPIWAAADRYRQECLIRMGAFYDMNAVAVPVVVAGFNGALDPGLNLFGHTLQTAPLDATGETEFTLTSGKAALATTAIPIAIGLFAKHASHASFYVGTPTFQIDAIEHDVVPVIIEGTTYQVGSWLKFVNPRPSLTMPPLAIPIPLRAFPQPPQLSRQYAVELSSDPDAPKTDDANLQLELAKSWSLNGDYQHTYAAQDRVHLDVLINSGLSGVSMLRSTAPTKDLLDTLLEFNQIYPQLQALFAGKLAAIRTPEKAKDATTLQHALNSLATLVDGVATCQWTLASAKAHLKALRNDGLIARETRYTIQDGVTVVPPDDLWRCEVKFEQDVGNPVGIIPQPQIDGYRTVVDKPSDKSIIKPSDKSIIYTFEDRAHPGSFLKAETAWQIAGQTIAVMPAYSTPFRPLDIVDRQNGLLSMMIRRNEDLPPLFHYETPWVTYNETISPILDTTSRIDVAGIGQTGGQPAARSLVGHLNALFVALMQGSGEPQPISGSFQAASYFAYPPSISSIGAPVLSLVDLPISLRLPTEIQFDAPIAGTPAYVTAMADSITTWLSANGLSATRANLWQNSELRFDISLFSNASLTGRPILRLRNLFIPCRLIA